MNTRRILIGIGKKIDELTKPAAMINYLDVCYAYTNDTALGLHLYLHASIFYFTLLKSWFCSLMGVDEDVALKHANTLATAVDTIAFTYAIYSLAMIATNQRAWHGYQQMKANGRSELPSTLVTTGVGFIAIGQMLSNTSYLPAASIGMLAGSLCFEVSKRQLQKGLTFLDMPKTIKMQDEHTNGDTNGHANGRINGYTQRASA